MRRFNLMTTAWLLAFPIVSSAASVPLGAQRVPFLALTFDVPCGDGAVLQSVTLRHEGAGEDTDVSAVYAMLGGRRVTRAAMFRTSEATLRFRGLVLPACEKTVLQVLGDISPDASADGEHRIVFESAEIRGAPAEVTQETHGGGVRVGAGESIGEVSIESLPLLLPVRYGANRTVGRLRISSTSRRDQALTAITFTNEGSARGADLQNISLRASRGARLTSVAPSLDGDRVRLVFEPPLALRRGEELLLELRADIRASSRRTLRLEIEEYSDVETAPCTGKRSCVQAH